MWLVLDGFFTVWLTVLAVELLVVGLTKFVAELLPAGGSILSGIRLLGGDCGSLLSVWLTMSLAELLPTGLNILSGIHLLGRDREGLFVFWLTVWAVGLLVGVDKVSC